MELYHCKLCARVCGKVFWHVIARRSSTNIDFDDEMAKSVTNISDMLSTYFVININLSSSTCHNEKVSQVNSKGYFHPPRKD